MTDMETGYKAFKKDVIKSIDIEETSFGVEPEITIKLAKKIIFFMKYQFHMLADLILKEKNWN